METLKEEVNSKKNALKKNKDNKENKKAASRSVKLREAALWKH